MGGVGQIASLISHHLIAEMPALAQRRAGEMGGGWRERPLRQKLWLRLFSSDGEPAFWEKKKRGGKDFFHSV